jgi:hypothetical protein
MSSNNDSHINAAIAAFKSGKSTIDVQVLLRGGPHYRTPSQANACVRTARKRMGVYDSLKKNEKARNERAKKDADRQSKKKTKVNDG